MTEAEVRGRIRRIELREVMRRTRLPEGGIALDVGCGPGVQAAMLRERFRLVVGLDIRVPPEAKSRATLVRASADRLPFRDGVFDFVHSSYSLAYVPRRDGAVREMARVRRAGGAIVVTVATVAWLLWAAWTSLRGALRRRDWVRVRWVLAGETEGAYRNRKEELLAYRFDAWRRYFRRFGLRPRVIPLPVLYGRPEVSLCFWRALPGLSSGVAFRM